MQRIQLSIEVAKRRVKQAEVEQQTNPWDRSQSKRVNVSELQAKLKLIEGRIALRLSKAGTLGTPRLEQLCLQLGLDVSVAAHPAPACACAEGKHSLPSPGLRVCRRETLGLLRGVQGG